MLGTVRMSNTIQEPPVLVGLHPGLDAVEGERGERGEDTGRAGRDFDAVSLHERLWPSPSARRLLLTAVVAPSGSGVGQRHDGWGGAAGRDILVTSNLSLSGHAAAVKCLASRGRR